MSYFSGKQGIKNIWGVYFVQPTVIALVFLLLIGPTYPVFAMEIEDSGPISSPATDSNPAETPSIDSSPVVDLPAPGLEEKEESLFPDSEVTEPEMPNSDALPKDKKEEDGKSDKALDPESQQNSMMSGGSGNIGPNTNPNENVKLGHPKADEASGALAYEYNFQIPPGRNGFQPELKLVYNSQSAEEDSHFGYGWNISIPYIERLNKTGSEKLYTDNYFTSSLSGELVSLGSGVYGAKTENGDFLKYTFTNNIWTVKDKKGLTYTFGLTSASRQDDPENASKVYKWMLTEIRDLNDNFIIYSYYRNSGQIYPLRIEYTGNGSNPGRFQISFDTTSRQISGNTPDNFTSYKTGFQVLTMYIIDKIAVRIDGGSGNGDSGVDYQFEYIRGANLNRLMLSSIQSSDWSTGTLVTLPKTSFEYQIPDQPSRTWTKDSNWTFPTDGNNFESHQTSLDSGSRLVDLNGDGLLDLLARNPTVDSFSFNKTKIYINNGHGWVYDSSWAMPRVSSPSCSNSEYELMFGGTISQEDTGVRITDMNGDNKADILVLNQHYICGPTTSFDPHALFLNNGNGWTQNTTWTLPDITTGTGSQGQSTSDATRIGDINGDGLPDFVRSYVTATGTWGVYNHFVNFWVNNGSGWQETTSFTMPIVKGCRHGDGTYENLPIVFRGQTTSRDTGHMFTDVNNDGLSDIVTGSSACNNINLNSGPLTAEPAVWLNTGTTWVKQTDLALQIKPGNRSWSDVNGDNLVDYLWSKFNNPDSPQYQNIESSAVTSNGYGGLTYGYWPMQSTPYNGSGLIPWSFPTELSCEGVPATVSFQNHYEGDNFYTENNGGHSTTTGLQNIDINGDGMPDLFKMNQEIPCLQTQNFYPYVVPPAKRSEMWLNQAKKSDLLTKITYPQGGTTQITYKPSQLYTDGQGNKLNTNVPFVMHTVNIIVNDDKNGNVGTTTYAYEGGKYYFNTPLDRKFAGFSKVTIVDPAGHKTVNYYHQGDTTNSSMGEYSDHNSKIGRVYRTEITNGSGNIYSKSINKWENYDLGNGRHFVKLGQTLEQSYDSDSDHKDKGSTYTYNDANGNLIQQVSFGEVTGSDNGTFTDTGSDKLTTSYTYAANTGLNIIGLPSQETIVDQSSNKVKESKYYYDTLALGSVNKGNLTKEEKWKIGTTYIDIEKTYNAFGLVTQEKDPRDKITTYVYDSYNLYPISVANHLNQTTLYSYDYSSGNPKLITDSNGVKTENRFDGFDRLQGVYVSDQSNFNSLINTESYQYTTTPLQYEIFKTSFLSDTNGVQENYLYDGFNRIKMKMVESEEENFSSRVAYIYDAKGSLLKESLPYFSNGPSTPTTDQALYTTYSYDASNRISSVVNSAGTTFNAYDDWKTTITDPKGKVKHLYKDAHGQLVKVEEVNGASTYVTLYEYNGQSNLTKITDALNNVRNFTYDGLGRRLTAQDLHAPSDVTFGTWTYSYDDAGNLASSVDPKNQTINYTYDNLNRVLTKDFTGQAGTETTYTYDACLVGIGKLCTVANAGANESKEYNSLGLIKKETRTIDSVNYVTEYTYDRVGNELTVKYPDNSEVKNTYNNGGLLETVQRKESADGSFANLITDFDYNPLGKITYQAHSNGVNTASTYDAAKLYRLSNKTTTRPGGSKAQDLTYTYDNVGNVTKIVDNSNTNTKKTVDYTYDDLHRLLSATTTGAVNGQNYTQNYTYDALGNILNKSDAGAYSYEGNTGSSYANPHAMTKVVGAGSGVTGTELLTAPWNLSGNNGSDEKYQSVPQNILNGKVSITVTYDLHGICALGGDASAIIFDQNGWKFVSLSNYGQNCLNGPQTVTIPLSAFTGLNTNANLTGSLHSRFWYGSAFTVDITSIKINAPATETTNYGYDNNGNLTSISSQASAVPWYATGGTWTDRKQITVDETKIPGTTNLTDFPMLFKTTDPDLRTVANGGKVGKTDGTDILFTQNNTSKLDHEIEKYNPATGELVAWVRVPSLLAAQNSPIYAYFGNATASDQQNKAAVWNTNYKGVWHFNNSLSDSTTNAKNLTNGGSTNSTAGKIADARAFNGTNQTAYTTSIPTNVTNNFTMEGWAYVNSASNGQIIASNGYDSGGGGGGSGWSIMIANGRWYVLYNMVVMQDTGVAVTTNTWHHVAIVRDNGTSKFYLNGAQIGSNLATSPTVPTSMFAVGGQANSTTPTFWRYSNSQVDELRVLTIPRNGDWLTAEYNNQNNPGTFYSYGPVTGTGTTMTWDYNNRMVAHNGGSAATTYAYDDSGQRVKYSNGTTTTVYPNRLYNVAGAKKTKHIFANGQMIATVETNGAVTTVYNDHTDHLTGSNAITDSAGAIVELLDYYPYGGIRLDEKSGSFTEQRKFTGYEYDTETGLNYAGARYYSANIGKFAGQDPLFQSMGDDYEVYARTGMPLQMLLSDPQSLNSYSYVKNNPLRLTDPNGEFWKEFSSFMSGAGNAIVSNNAFGYGRNSSSNSSYNAGQTVGDVISLVQGSFETAVGIVATATGAAGGVVLSPTGVGAVAGAGVATAGLVATGHGFGTASTATKNLMSGKGSGSTYSSPSQREINSVKNKWYNSSFKNTDEAIKYHHEKHANGRSLEQMTNDARNTYTKYRDERRPTVLKDGSQGWDIKIPGSREGGIYSGDGKVVSYWY
jgi:RHS repeat-associated protein